MQIFHVCLNDHAKIAMKFLHPSCIYTRPLTPLDGLLPTLWWGSWTMRSTQSSSLLTVPSSSFQMLDRWRGWWTTPSTGCFQPSTASWPRFFWQMERTTSSLLVLTWRLSTLTCITPHAWPIPYIESAKRFANTFSCFKKVFLKSPHRRSLYKVLWSTVSPRADSDQVGDMDTDNLEKIKTIINEFDSDVAVSIKEGKEFSSPRPFVPTSSSSAATWPFSLMPSLS